MQKMVHIARVASELRRTPTYICGTNPLITKLQHPPQHKTAFFYHTPMLNAFKRKYDALERKAIRSLNLN
jgi:hypothetical protein